VSFGLVSVLAACSGSGSPSVTPSTSPPATATSTAPPTSTAAQSTSTTAPGAPTTTAPAGAPASPIGVIWDYAKQDSFKPYLDRLRGGTTWYELEWCQVQPDQATGPDWTRADKNIGRALSVGIEPMLRIRVGSCWATGGDKIDAGRGGLGYSVSAPPVDEAAYQAFVRSVVQRYQPKGVRTYAIENEVNGEGFWRGTPQQYDALLRAGASAVRQVDPTARVLDAGLSSTAWGVVLAQALLDQGKPADALAAYNAYYERRFERRETDFPHAGNEAELRAALATDKSKENLAYAATTFALAKDGVIDALQLHFYEKWTNVAPLMAFLKGAVPAGMPIEVWEAGVFWPDSTSNEAAVAGETARLVYLLLGGGAERVIFLPMQSNTAASGSELRPGLLDANFQPRAGYEALADLAEFARNGGSGWQVVTGTDGAQAVVGTAPSGAQALLWSDQAPVTVQGLAPEVTLTSLDGTPATPSGATQVGTDPLVATGPTAPQLASLIGA
jgi:hypothetical protein